MRRIRLYVLLAAAAAGVELMAAATVTLPGRPLSLLGGVVLHIAASLLSRWAAARRRPDLSRVEGDIVLSSALLIPVFGPALAWALPRASVEEKVETAHELFEQYAAYVKPADTGYKRTLFTGDYVKDLARELDAESYHAVLRHGSTDQKRNALRRLAELGEPRHFALIRSCLLDPEHEVRLYAYSELERAGRVYEEEIAKRAAQLKHDPRDTEALLAMARAYFGYAASGIHDEHMAAFYFRAAERYAHDARQAGFAGPETVFVEAAALGKLRRFEEAEACLDSLPPDAQTLSACCLTRAELAYRRRDFAGARAEAERIRRSGEALPGWLAALEERR